MRLKCSAPWWRMFTLFLFIIPSITLATLHDDDSGIPALLQFAEQYNEQEKVPVISRPKRDMPVTSKSKGERGIQGDHKFPRPKREYWKIKDKEIQQQQAIINRLEVQLAIVHHPQSAVPPDFHPLGKLAQGIRQALAITPTEHQAKKLIAQAQQQWRLDKSELQRQLSEAQKSSLALSAEITKQNALMSVEKNEKQKLLQQQQELQHQWTLMQTELDSATGGMANLRTELSSLQDQLPRRVDAERLKQPRLREDYAAGISLGEEILQMQQERHEWGVNADTQLILAGITDAFAGKRELTDDELTQALTAAEKRIIAAREKTIAFQKHSGSVYLDEFKKDKRTRQAPYGFWYRVDYAGDSNIPDKASVDIEVKETLVDGTVIQDMGASGTTLSQPVEQFPPLFREAIRLLKNHGTITLVVPPEFAYGDKGYPPKVPPNATMVYTLRIAEMYP